VHSRIAIAVFIKAPYPGQVKTRLAKDIGEQAAVQLYRCFVQDVLSSVNTLGQDCLLFYSPPAAGQELQEWLGPIYQYYPQCNGDLGDRMAAAFQQGFSLGYDGMLLLGSDAPDLPCSILENAVQQLQQEMVVIGPSEDGGYYSLGFTQNNFCSVIFQDIPWSTSDVYALTLERLTQANRSVHVLPQWLDIDVLDHLRKFYYRNLSNHSSTAISYLKKNKISVN
jgi:uncharacterized protein